MSHSLIPIPESENEGSQSCGSEYLKVGLITICIVTLTTLAALLVWEFSSLFSKHEYSPEEHYQHQHSSPKDFGHLCVALQDQEVNHDEDKMGDGDQKRGKDHAEGEEKTGGGKLKHTEGKVDEGGNKQEMEAKEGGLKEEEEPKETEACFTDQKQAVELLNKEKIEVEDERHHAEENHGHGWIKTVVYILILILILLGGDYIIQRLRRNNYKELNSAPPQTDLLAPTTSEYIASGLRRVARP